MEHPDLWAHVPKREDRVTRLVPLALELAQRAGPGGVTVSDLRLTAVQRGLLTGGEQGKELSYLGAVMRRAGLRSTGGTRRSHVPVTHGIRQVVWIHPDHAGTAA